MSVLVTLPELKGYLGDKITGDFDVLLETILDHAEEVLADDTGQIFAAAGAVTDEPRNGSGDSFLRLKRPPNTLDAGVKFGQDSTDPVSTIAASEFIVDGDKRRIIYQSGVFPQGIRNVFVSYTALENLPTVTRLAILEFSAFLFQRRGLEHVTGTSFPDAGSISTVAARVRFLPAWGQAVAKLQQLVV